MNHFQKEGYLQRTIYNIINRFHNGDSIEDKIKTGRPTSWTSTRKNKLKRSTIASQELKFGADIFRRIEFCYSYNSKHIDSWDLVNFRLIDSWDLVNSRLRDLENLVNFRFIDS